MCSVLVIEFFINNLDCSGFRDKRVLEVSSKYVNGNVRPLIERFCQPREHVGVNIEKDWSADIILLAEKLVEYFGQESFDVGHRHSYT